MRSASIEDYIKTIYLLESEHQRATTQRIAKQMDVRMASVTGMIKHLAAEDLVTHKPYRGVTLTDEGKRIALQMLRRHRLIELFLHKTLGMNWDEVHDDAEVMEHAMSDKLIERIYHYLGKPKFDPHGSPIPASDGTVIEHDSTRLIDCEPGTKTRIVHVSDDDAEFLRYLTRMELSIGSEIELIEKPSSDGPITLRADNKNVILESDAACRIFVESTPSNSS